LTVALHFWFDITERPLHPEERLYSVIMAWGNWCDTYTKTVCLCLKTSDLLTKIDKSVSTLYSVKEWCSGVVVSVAGHEKIQTAV